MMSVRKLLWVQTLWVPDHVGQGDGGDSDTSSSPGTRL